MTLLRGENLCKTYPNGTQALSQINFSVEEGEFLVVIGLSGSGKSTLLRCINQLHPISSGAIHFEQQRLDQLHGRALRQQRSRIGMIFQQFNLIPRKSVLTNVLAGALASTPIWKSLLGLYSKKQQQQALAYLRIVGLEHKAYVRADNLSGGQQQRVAIARALMQNPKILLADEPVASLDPSTSHSVMKYLQKINRELGVTVICNLHFLSLVRTYASRVLALKDGKIVYQGAPEDIDEQWFKTIYGEEAVEVSIN
ncbi:phosphonate ABC transporter ATP-binding protein [Alkalimonas sp. MEB108]|uniref:Phosphonate ABC transporter ATP-binding protein n=1 Tax=Alkalimonas cellulosilytica TaxID=3058395 RepID=A0ABU7J3C6_9GAMM|nr:phosphonate ABC transporter ATP-binding protein [Alkalimonas sp. MEB108]MEE2000532.1 phosphonate ABC transporter ATP-binding protein [Alkalimonas sp. MEB108]